MAALCRKSDFILASIFPLSALRDTLFFDRHERAEFQHAQVLKKILLMHSSALNGDGNDEMA
jgi:hypothetical protein